MRSLAACALLISSCAAAQEVTGEYRLRMPEVASGLLLRPDSTFEYFFTYGAADYTAKGTWRSESGTVVLNTSGKEEPTFRLVKTGTGGEAEIRVHVQAPNGRGVAHIDITLATSGGNTQARTGQDGVAILPRRGAAKSMSIHVPVYDVEAGPFDIDGKANEFWFEINSDAITQVRFRNERLKITDDGLELTFWKTDKPLKYRKQ